MELGIWRGLANPISRYKFKLDLLIARLGFLSFLDWQNIRVYFIVSTGRTGTKFLAEFLNKFEGIEARHEPRPHFLKLANEYAVGKIDFDTTKKRIGRLRKIILRELRKLNADVYVESNNRLFSLIPVLRAIFKDSKIIHIVRDGRDIVRSGMSRMWYKPDDPFSRIKATDFPGDPYFEEWGNMSRFEKICWWWQKKDSFIYEAVKDRKDCITVRFEDIFDSDRDYSGMRTIMDFMNLNTNIELNANVMSKVHSSHSYETPHWKNWEVHLRHKFMNIAGQHMKRYGYFNESTEPVRQPGTEFTI